MPDQSKAERTRTNDDPTKNATAVMNTNARSAGEGDMTEHQRWFWRMSEDQRHNPSNKTNLFWDEIVAMVRRHPRFMAKLEFEAAMREFQRSDKR